YVLAIDAVTDCERLRVLCRGIVSDELAHVACESQLLSALRAGHGAPLRALTRSAHRIFFAGTAIVVWLTHRSVLRHAGHSARSFLRSGQVQYKFYLEPAGVRVAAMPCCSGASAGNEVRPGSPASGPSAAPGCLL